MERYKYYLPNPEDRQAIGKYVYYWACALCGNIVGVNSKEEAIRQMEAHARIIFEVNAEGKTHLGKHKLGRHIQMGETKNIPNEPEKEENTNNRWVALKLGPLALNKD